MTILTRKIRVASTHSGGGIGFSRLNKALYEFVLGVEMDKKIARCYSLNYGAAHLLVKKIEAMTKADWLRALLHGEVDIAQFSPVCKNFSRAKKGAQELKEDIDQARAVVRGIAYMRPKAVVVENVWKYRNSASFDIIVNALSKLGYRYEYRQINSADYGTPQTRKRLFLVALRPDLCRDGRYPFVWPTPTHHNAPAVTDLFGNITHRWVSWYEAVEDILDTFPTCDFGKWQLERLDDYFREKGYDFDSIQSFLADDKSTRSNGKPHLTMRQADEPALTLLASPHNRPKAFLIPGDNTTNGVVREEDQPMVTLRARPLNRCPHRAFIVDGQPGSFNTKITLRDMDEPCHTIQASVSRKPVRAWLEYGTVRQFTVRGIARIQGVPDDYVFSGHAGTDSTVVGNGIAAQVIEHLFEKIVEVIAKAEGQELAQAS